MLSKFLKYILLINFTLVGFAVLAGQLAFPDTIKVKGDHYYPPFEFINEKGEPDGFNIELFRALAKELNLNFHLELDQWSKIRKELETGQIDVITGMMVSSSRAEKMKFGTPHSIMTHAIFTRKSGVINKVEDLKDKEIIVQDGDRMHDFLIETGLTNNIIAVSTQLEALKLLNNGKHDAALIGYFQGGYLIRKYKLKNVHSVAADIEPEKYAMAVSLNNDELLWLLNMGLYQLKEKGIYDELYNKWFGVYEDYSIIKKHKSQFILILLLIGSLLFFVVFLQFEIKKAKEKIMQSESRYRDIFHNNHAIMLIVDPESGQIVDANPAAINFYGYRKEQLLKMHISDINTLSLPEIQNAMKNSRENNLHFFNFEHRLASGEVKNVEVYTGPVKFGKEQYLYSIIHDVTEKKTTQLALKSSEEKLKQIFKLAPSGMGIIVNREFVNVNPKFCEMTGYSQKELIGNSSRMIYPSDREFEFVRKEEYEQILKSGTGVVETQFKHRDGRILDVIMSSSAIDPSDLSKGVIFTATDITQQNEIKKQIHLANEHLRQHVENSPLAVIEWDNQHRVKFWSKQAENLFGWSANEVMGKHPFEWNFVFKDDSFRVNQKIYDVIHGNSTRTSSYNRNFNKAGKVLVCQWYNSSITDQNGALISILSLVNDVTELKSIEQKLLDERRRLAWIIESTNAGTWEWDLTYDRIEINEEYAAFIGYKAADLIPFSFSRMEELIHPDDFELVKEQLKKHFLNPAAEYECEARFKHKNGHWVWQLIKGRVMSYSANGEPLIMSGMNTNISRRKAAEEQIRQSEMLLKMAGQLANLGGWWYDINADMVFWSEEVAAMHEMPVSYTPRAEEALSFYLPEYRDKIVALFTDCIENGNAFDEIMQLCTSSGKVIWVRTIGTPKYGSKGNVIAVQGAIQDITQQKIAENEILKLNAELEEKVEERTAMLSATNKELEAFSYSVSHDLKAPLRAIDGFVGILVEDYAPLIGEEGLRISEIIRSNTKKMNRLINDLLIFSRYGRSKMILSLVDMKSLAITCFNEIIGSNTNVHLNIENICSVTGDKNLLTQVWMNLISNAVKFTSKNSEPQIWISCAISEKNCVYQIRDNGVGFDSNYVDKIFEVFQRLHNEDEFEGTGVGLAIVKRIIHRHNGQIWAESTPGQGATFSFALPLSIET